jgi:hypothetical protein
MAYRKSHNELIADGWEQTDASTSQYMKMLVEDEVYLFREERDMNGAKYVFEKEMRWEDYASGDIASWDRIVSACEAFGYTAKQVDKWITAGEEIPLMLECLFELTPD